MGQFCDGVVESKLLSDVPLDYAELCRTNYKNWGNQNPDKFNSGASELYRVLNTIDHVDPSDESATVIGVLGKWGSGKTSILRGVKKYFETHKKENGKYGETIVVYYEAWKYFDRDNPLLPLVLTLRENFRNRFKNDKSIDNRSINEKLGELTRKITRAVALSATINMPIMPVSFSPGRFMENLTEKKSEATMSIDKEMKELFNSITGKSGNKKARLVILIDDMDRLFPEEALKLLQVIRFYFDAENVITVVAVDDSMLESFIELKYNKFVENKNFFGKNFLRKIIQYPIYLNPVSYQDAFKYFEEVRGITTKGLSSYLNRMPDMSYRLWKRVVNRALESIKKLCIASKARFKPAANTIERIFFFAILKECFPDIDDYLRTHPALEKEIGVSFRNFASFASRNNINAAKGEFEKKERDLFSFFNDYGKKNLFGRESAIWEVIFK